MQSTLVLLYYYYYYYYYYLKEIVELNVQLLLHLYLLPKNGLDECAFNIYNENKPNKEKGLGNGH